MCVCFFFFFFFFFVVFFFIFLVKITEWPPIGKIAAHSAYEMYSWYKYLGPVVQNFVGLTSSLRPLLVK